MKLIELITQTGGEMVQRTFSKEHILIGRAESNDIVLHDPRVSNLHGQIILREKSWFYQDLQSTNGSAIESAGERFIIDGVKFKERELTDGDTLLLGDTEEPSVVQVRVFEGEAEGEAQASEGKTILASRAISDFALLSGQILDDKSLVRALFRFQKEIHEMEKAQDIYQASALFLLNHVPNAEYVALHRENPNGKAPWKQVYFTSKSRDILLEAKEENPLFATVAEEQRALLIDKEELGDFRRAGKNASRLGSQILSPLVGQEQGIGFIEIGNTATSNPLSEADLDFVSVVAYVLSARIVNLKLLEIVYRAKEKLKNENVYLKSYIEKESGEWELVGESLEIASVKRQIETVGKSDLTVMILGETGTGKELVARAVHEHSDRTDGLFAAVNCGTFSDTLLESELFGHVKGAFTGAVETKKGIFEVADGGTLFLDEIGETPLNLQVKLLRALQEGEIMPVGANQPKKVDVRVVCATNKDLEKEVEENRFREDLYYRINTFPINLPPLRERGDDIVLLAKHFLAHFQNQMKKFGNEFSADCLSKLRQCPFPGNVRQMKNEIQRALLLAEENEPIEIHHFSTQIARKIIEERVEPVKLSGKRLKDVMEAYEVNIIRQALEEHGWNRSQTALALGISRQAFMAKLSKFGITPDK